ncbi:hypothetical protein LINPERPRIM_LOCUS30036 [Linum perenne]
MGSSRWSFIG